MGRSAGSHGTLSRSSALSQRSAACSSGRGIPPSNSRTAKARNWARPLGSGTSGPRNVANDVQFGLSASIYTRDANVAMKFVERSEVGMVHVNNPTVGGEAQLPFGGWKSTGVGEREMAEEGAEFFTQLKTVFFDYTGQVRTSKMY